MTKNFKIFINILNKRNILLLGNDLFLSDFGLALDFTKENVPKQLKEPIG
jgi:hypothetical protein